MPLDYVWGVDPALSRLAVAFAPADGGSVEVSTLQTDTELREGQRLGLLDRQVRIWARQLAGDWPPSVVWVEQPSGRYRNLPLTYAVGVVQAALSETLAVPVWMIASSAWKARTVGAGNASKAQVSAWVAARGADLASQDEADAYCIAVAGRAMLLARSWEAAA
jgi:Holliday junction resolvasome RuvABC endonuclease subunit